MTLANASVCVPRQKKTVNITGSGVLRIVNVCVAKKSVQERNFVTQVKIVTVYSWSKSVELKQLRSKFFMSAVEPLGLEPLPYGPTGVLIIHRIAFSIFSLGRHYIRDLLILSTRFLSSSHHSNTSFSKNVIVPEKR